MDNITNKDIDGLSDFSSPFYENEKYNNKQYNEIFENINILLDEKDRLLVAIDGMSCSGKTTLSMLLQDTYDCNLFHMDDFFLTPDLRTEDRLKEIGGNVDYVRFNKEVLSMIESGHSFSYQVYNCQTQLMSEEVAVKPKKLNIVEGAYSMHPTLIQHYDLKVFLKADPDKQSQRILKRNGKVGHEKFINLWIPLENEYFDKFKIEEKSDIVVNVDG